MTTEKPLIIENQYFPNVIWFKNSFAHKHVILSSCETYKKMSFRNRTIICGSNGLINLSVPIMNGRNQKVPYKEVKISYGENWQMNHWRSIISCYGKSPFFYIYELELKRFFERKYSFLFDMNFEILDWLRKITKLPAEITVKEGDEFEIKDTDIVNMTDKCLPKNFQNNQPVIKYSQVFEDRTRFQANLSILDMLFNIGPETTRLLSR